MIDDRTGELLDAERRLQAAQLAGDVDALDRLIHDDLLAIGPDGTQVTKAMDLHSHRDRVLVVTSLVQEELAYVVAGDAGVTTIVAAMSGSNTGQPFEVRMRYTRTWVRDDEHGWRILAAHLSVV